VEEKGWYSDREMFEMLNGLKLELIKTQEHIKKYNGLLDKFEGVNRRLTKVEEQAEGRSSAARSFRDWGGWLAGAIGIIIAGLSLIHK